MFKIGDRVFDINYGWGVVLSVKDGVNVSFDNIERCNDEMIMYSLNGICDGSVRTLYHHDYTPTETQELNVCESETLTKREKFAGMAMQGILAGRNREAVTEIRGLVEIAIECADELIKGLNENL